MKVLIVEDEMPAAEKLERLLKQYDPDIEIAGRFDTVEKTVNWLKDMDNKADLIFLDIQLADGLSFEIFNQVQINEPIIFTTAYNEYAIEAFKVNSIDYLLKPITYDNLYRSMTKLERLRESLPTSKHRIQFEELSQALTQLQKNYKTRFMVKVGEHIRSVTTDNISLFYAEGRTVFMLTGHGKRFIIDYKLEELESLLNPSRFYRVSRSFIVNINAITDVIMYSNSRLKVRLNQEFDKEIIVSREKVSQFKIWFDGLEEERIQ
ncbi:MAG: response regulator transcription factor [Bacteroidales bacterium]|nr:MAG: response regulator transcription factor [Bacteroidales bacterium]